MSDLLITGGKIVNEGRSAEQDVLVRQGRIERIGLSISPPSPSCKIIDASGKLLQYLRYPVTEQRITETMNKIYDNTDATILAGCTASNLSIHAFDKTYEYFKQNLKDITQLDMGIVTEPEEFTVDAIPESIRHVYIETTEKVIAQIKADSKSIRKLMMIDRLENVIHRLKNQKYKKQLHLKLQNTIETQDSKRNLKLIDVDPFLHDWIYNKYTA